MAEYPAFEQSLENNSIDHYKFLDKWFSAFNPQAPQVENVNTTPYFQKGAQDTDALMKTLTGGSAPGEFDVAGYKEGNDAKAGNEADKSNLDNSMRSMLENANLTQKQGVNNFERGNMISDTEDKVNDLPTQRRAVQLQADDATKQMWANYNNSQDPLGNIFGGILGGFAGALGGKKLFKSGPNSREYQMEHGIGYQGYDGNTNFGPAF